MMDIDSSQASTGADSSSRSLVLAGLRGAMERELDGLDDASRSFAEVSLTLARVEQIARVARDVLVAMEGRLACKRRGRRDGQSADVQVGGGDSDNVEMESYDGGLGPDRGETLAARAIREVVALLPKFVESAAERNRPPRETLVRELVEAAKTAREAGLTRVAAQAEQLAAARLCEIAAAGRGLIPVLAAPDNGATQTEEEAS